jgi:hypothetical protein
LKENIRSGRATLSGPLDSVERVDDDVCILSNMYSHNFYHFVEELNKVIILERGNFQGRYVVSTHPSHLSPVLPNFSLEFLDLSWRRLGSGDFVLAANDFSVGAFYHPNSQSSNGRIPKRILCLARGIA